MLVDIDRIRLADRIRRDYGDVAELAADIAENGLIQPPLVTPELLLIAGERRLRACKSLGWKQLEVRVMPVRDAVHLLRLEVSENENRKDFTFSERMRWAARLEAALRQVAAGNSAANLPGRSGRRARRWAAWKRPWRSRPASAGGTSTARPNTS